MNIICILFGHNWNKWKYVRSSGRYEEQIKKVCNRCHKEEFFTGFITKDNKGNIIPDKN